MVEDQGLNEDAIYAALCWARNNPHRRKLTPPHVLSEKIVAEESQPGVFLPQPEVDASAEEIEAIYPGKPASVQRGFTVSRQILASSGSATFYAKQDNEVGRAVKRFLAEFPEYETKSR